MNTLGWLWGLMMTLAVIILMLVVAEHSRALRAAGVWP